jgi:hypothetical protein
MTKPTPPRGTTRVVDQGPPDLAPCPGCDTAIRRGTIACPSCFQRISGDLKGELSRTEPGTSARKRVVTKMRMSLAGWLDSPS